MFNGRLSWANDPQIFERVEAAQERRQKWLNDCARFCPQGLDWWDAKQTAQQETPDASSVSATCDVVVPGLVQGDDSTADGSSKG